MKKKLVNFIYYSGVVLGLLSLSSISYCTEGRVYDEYETVAGDIIGIGGTGASVSSQISSVRVNPAGITAKKNYSIEGSYNKASFGGNFYQLGIIDNKTSAVGAGLLFSDFKDSVYSRRNKNVEEEAPIKRRFYLALAMGNELLSVGLMANYIEAIDDTESNITGETIIKRKKGFTAISPGFLFNLGPQFKIGISAENLFNSSLKEYNPKFYRFGSSYHYSSEVIKLAINLDYRGRERINKEKEFDSSLKDLESMVFLGSSIIFSDIIKIMAGYGHEISGKRTSLSYGIALMKDDSSVSFGCLYPYFNKKKDTHMGVNLTYSVVI